MFVDEARVRVVAGSGGDGCISFRREKFVPKGGPDGGDGGDGGDVILQVDPGLRTLLHLRHAKLFKAGHGRPGQGKERTGRRGADCSLRLPPGTIVRDAASGAWIADLTAPGENLVVAHGGKGGKGNTRFKSSTRRAPRIATDGKEGESRELAIELRLLADIGLVGLPNVGKSTLLARLSNARPRIGDYPFTTLAPNLGIVAIGEDYSFVMADIPGLVEGAHKGRGLGIRFLKHVERTRVLLFMIDSMSEDPEADLTVLHNEIAKFSPALARRPRLVGFSKADLRPTRWRPPKVARQTALAFSAHTGRGVAGLLRRLRGLLEELGDGDQLDERASTAERAADRPFADRIDRQEDLGAYPWPRRAHAAPADTNGETAADG
jgi:GTP-binding protein